MCMNKIKDFKMVNWNTRELGPCDTMCFSSNENTGENNCELVIIVRRNYYCNKALKP